MWIVRLYLLRLYLLMLIGIQKPQTENLRLVKYLKEGSFIPLFVSG